MRGYRVVNSRQTQAAEEGFARFCIERRPKDRRLKYTRPLREYGCALLDSAPIGKVPLHFELHCLRMWRHAWDLQRPL